MSARRARRAVDLARHRGRRGLDRAGLKLMAPDPVRIWRGGRPPRSWWLLMVAARYIEPILLPFVIEIAILGILKEHEAHGYELKKRMAELAGGSGGVSFGSLYPALSRLELAGAVRTIDHARPRLRSAASSTPSPASASSSGGGPT